MPLSEASTKGVSITANRVLHPRIIKAVIKEKWKDIAYKLECEPRTVIMWHKIKGPVITFYLKQQISAINQEII